MVKMLPWFSVAALTLGAGTVALLLNSCSTAGRAVVVPPKIEGATFVGDKACADYTAESRAFFRPVHTRDCGWNTGKWPARIAANPATALAANMSPRARVEPIS